jgi:hypothetical protein
MRLSRFTDEQIIAIVKKPETGVKTVDLCRRHGISDAMFGEAFLYAASCVILLRRLAR